MSIDVLSGLSLKVRQHNSFGQDNKPITDVAGTGSPIVFQHIGGLVQSGTPSYIHGVAAPLQLNSGGRLLVDGEGDTNALITQLFNQSMSLQEQILKELQILNTHQEIITGDMIKENEIRR